jgi:hypothetical protein
MLKFRIAVLLVASGALLDACFVGDIGPIDEVTRDLTAVDFDRLEMGDAFHVDVQPGTFFRVTARGDREDVNDLTTEKQGTTLVVSYGSHRSRHRHDMYITVTMPQLLAVSFSGACQSRISGFTCDDRFTVNLSGASVCQLEVTAGSLMSVLSGASVLSVQGQADDLDGDISGASALHAFDFPVSTAHVSVSGASEGKIAVADDLRAVATGASVLIYRGQPAVASDVSGASVVYQDGKLPD